MKFKSFDKNDWMGFAGAEGTNPKVVYHTNAEGDWAAVADDHGIYVNLVKGADDFDGGMWDFHWQYECTQDMAEAMLKGLKFSELFDTSKISSFGFREC